MGKRSGLYIACVILFPLAFAGFVVGFGCPVWLAYSDVNSGLWQQCERVFKNCKSFDYDEGKDWLIAIRSVEVFALLMLVLAAAKLAHENCFSNFSGRKTAGRVAAGVLSVLGGLGGLSGVVVYAIKLNDTVTANGGPDFGWALIMVAAGSGLAFLVGVGFCVSGCILEKPDDPDKMPISAYGSPYNPSSHGGESFEMTTAYSNKGFSDGTGGGRPLPNPHFTSHALYNGVGRHPSSLHRMQPQDPPDAGYPPYHDRQGLPRSEPKRPQYYSYSGEDTHPQFDLSEGYLPSRSRANPYQVRDEGPYVGRRDLPHAGEDPYLLRGRGEDPYSHGRLGEEVSYARREQPFSISPGVESSMYPGGAPRAGYPDSSRYLPATRGSGRAFGPYDDSRESFHRHGRY